jgi:hypothetical protein
LKRTKKEPLQNYICQSNPVLVPKTIVGQFFCPDGPVLKSPGREAVWVRVPAPAPIHRASVGRLHCPGPPMGGMGLCPRPPPWVRPGSPRSGRRESSRRPRDFWRGASPPRSRACGARAGAWLCRGGDRRCRHVSMWGTLQRPSHRASELGTPILTIGCSGRRIFAAAEPER